MHMEGLPVALLEALFYGNAVLVSDIPGNIEVIQDEGLLRGFRFRSGQLDSLINILQDLLEHHDKVENMRDKGRDLVIDKYDWNKIADETLDVYQSIIHE